MTLPYPPSVNHYWRRVGPRTLISREGRTFRKNVCALLGGGPRKPPSGGRIALAMDAYVFSSNAAPFEPNRGYSPFAVYSLLNHGGDFEQAARSLGQLGFGSDSLADSANGADMSGIMRMPVAPGACPSDNAALGQTMAMCDGQAAPVPEIADPGPLPAEMLRVPGFINEVNGDGIVGILDLGALGDNYGFDRSAIPEPGTLLLVTAGIVGLLRKRRGVSGQ